MEKLNLTATRFYQDAVLKARTEIGYSNKMEGPKIDKISINIGMGKYDNKQKQEIVSYLEKLTAQKPKQIKSKVSVAGFKLRKNELVACMVTLRGKKAEDFLANLVYIGLPRTRDFRGIKENSFDENYSTYSLGIPNASIFPSIGFDIPFQFGMQVNIKFKEQSEDNLVLLKKLNFPFKKI